MTKVLITGMGGMTPMGNTLDSITAALKAGQSNIRSWSCEHGRLKATSISPIDLEDYATAKKIPRAIWSETTALSVQAIERALPDAGLEEDIFADPRTAVVTARGMCDVDSIRQVLNYRTEKVSPFAMVKFVSSSLVASLTNLYNVKGSTHTVNHACASGLRALSVGGDLIRLGRADRVVVICAEKHFTENMAGFDVMKALYRGEAIEHASVPFSEHRKGFTFSEGSACVILESEAAYHQRGGSSAYSEFVHYEDFSDGTTITKPTGIGSATCLASIKADLTERGLSADFISAHGTSTPEGDPIEAEVIHRHFGDTPVVAFKRLTGHALTPVSLHELMYSTLMVKHGFMTPTPTPDFDPKIAPINLSSEYVERDLKTYVCNAFGFGGLNIVASFTKYEG